ncbi:hypothetical protein LINPERPRIM_LOCUS37218 [Linum perenne]
MRIEHDLVTSLVEKWKLETHTFHMPEEESIVTLKNDFIVIELLTNCLVISR